MVCFFWPSVLITCPKFYNLLPELELSISVPFALMLQIVNWKRLSLGGLALGYRGQIYDEYLVGLLWNFGSSGFNDLIASKIGLIRSLISYSSYCGDLVLFFFYCAAVQNWTEKFSSIECCRNDLLLLAKSEVCITLVLLKSPHLEVFHWLLDCSCDQHMFDAYMFCSSW